MGEKHEEKTGQAAQHAPGVERTITPDQAKLAAGLLREFVGDNIPEDTEINGQDVGDDAFGELIEALDAVAHQA